MGSAASTPTNDTTLPYQPPGPSSKAVISVSLQSTAPLAGTAAAAAAVDAPHQAVDDDDCPRLIDADSDADAAQDQPLEARRKLLMLPSSSSWPAQHVGRLLPSSSFDSHPSSAGQAVWVLPKSALQPQHNASTSPATPAGHCNSFEPPGPPVLLSPTFFLPCDPIAAGGCIGSSGSDACCTSEWQLVLEPCLEGPPAAPGPPATAPPHPQLSPSSPTPPTASAEVAQNLQGLVGSPLPATSSSTGSTAAVMWRPRVRLLCVCQGDSRRPVELLASTAAEAAGYTTAAAAHGSFAAGSNNSSPSSMISTSSDIQPVQVDAMHSAGVGSSSCSTSSEETGDQMSRGRAGVTNGVTSLIKQAEKKLLPSSWSSKRKSLAPASYRAAYSNLQDAEAVQGPSTAPATAASAAATAAALSVGSNGSSGSSGSSSWRLLCCGQLAVAIGADSTGVASQSAAALSLCNTDTPLTPSLTSSITIQCGGSSSSATSTNLGAAAITTQQTEPSSHTGPQKLQPLLLLSADTADTAHNAASIDSPALNSLPAPNADELLVQVAFSQLQLLPPEHSSSPTHAAPHLISHTDANSGHSIGTSSSSGSPNKHQLPPQGAAHQLNTAVQQLSPGGTANLAGSNGGSNGSSVVAAGGSVSHAVAAPRSAPVTRLEAVLLSHAPRLLVIDNFFTPELCTGLMELARDRLVRSRVASGSETPSRTSWGHFFVKESAKHPLILQAEELIEALFNSAAVRGSYGPLAKVEAMQVVRYHIGEFYHEHYDNRADGPLTRAATILVYLCDTDEGGATSFSRAVTGFGKCPEADAQVLPPKVTVGQDGRGIKVFPVQGRALVFWSKRPNGDEEPNSIHAAETVLKGEKWIATRWMKDSA